MHHSEYRKIGGSIKETIRATHGKVFTGGPVATTLYAAPGGSIDYTDDLGALGIYLELRPPRWGNGGSALPHPTAPSSFDANHP